MSNFNPKKEKTLKEDDTLKSSKGKNNSSFFCDYGQSLFCIQGSMS